MHARAVTLRNCSLWVCKFDRDLADSGHLALAAEQTEWLHLRVHVCVHMCVSSCSSEQEEEEEEEDGKKKIDAHNDLTAGNTHEAKDRPPPLSFSRPRLTSCEGLFNFFHWMCHPSLKGVTCIARRWARTKNSSSPALRSLSPLWESISLTQQKERCLILGFGF